MRWKGLAGRWARRRAGDQLEDQIEGDGEDGKLHEVEVDEDVNAREAATEGDDQGCPGPTVILGDVRGDDHGLMTHATP